MSRKAKKWWNIVFTVQISFQFDDFFFPNSKLLILRILDLRLITFLKVLDFFNFVPIFNFSPIFNFVHFIPNFNFFPNHQFCSILTILSRAVDWNFQSCFTACLQILWFVIFPSKRFNSTRKKTYGRKTSRLWQMWLSLQHCRITPHAHCSSPRRSNLTPNSRVWNMWKKFSRCLHFERTHFDTFGYQEIHLWHLWQAIKKWFMLPKTHDEYSWTKNLLWPLQQRL